MPNLLEDLFRRSVKPAAPHRSPEAVVRPTRSRGALAEIAQVLLLALLLYLAINFAGQTVHVIGYSMFPTVTDQDYLIATKIDYRFGNPQRGDIIIMRDPQDPSKDFIKRVIALPGDRLLIQDGRVYINGHVLREPYLNPEPWTFVNSWPAQTECGIAPPAGDRPGVAMGPDQYFVMGDNRNHSEDSRCFGPIARDKIEAHARFRLLPLMHLGPIGQTEPTLDPTVTLPAAA